MVARCVARSLDLYLEVVTGKKPEPLKLDDSDEQYLLEFQTCQTLSEVAALLLHFGGTHRKH